MSSEICQYCDQVIATISFKSFILNRYNKNTTDGVILWLSFTTVFYYYSTYLEYFWDRYIK